jgi:hypothetical protein
MKKLMLVVCLLMLGACKGKNGKDGANGVNGAPGLPGLNGPVMTKHAGSAPFTDFWVSAPEMTVDSLISVYWSPDGANGSRWAELSTPQVTGQRYAIGNLLEKKVYIYNMNVGDGFAIVILN